MPVPEHRLWTKTGRGDYALTIFAAEPYHGVFGIAHRQILFFYCTSSHTHCHSLQRHSRYLPYLPITRRYRQFPLTAFGSARLPLSAHPHATAPRIYGVRTAASVTRRILFIDCGAFGGSQRLRYRVHARDISNIARRRHGYMRGVYCTRTAPRVRRSGIFSLTIPAREGTGDGVGGGNEEALLRQASIRHSHLARA